MTSSQTVPAVVAAYADSVRRELQDLPAGDVEDLTEGLEADLMEQFEESGAVPALSPVAYAAELRSSAGLPERDAAVAGKKGPGIRDSFRKAGEDFLARVRANPASNAVLEFLIKLRPVWWLLRAWAIFQIISMFLESGRLLLIPRGTVAWIILLLLVVASVRMGSKPLPHRTWARRVLLWLSAAAIVVLLLAAPAIISRALMDYDAPTNYNSGYIPPLSVNGAPVEHVFVYDKDGKLLRDVRFYNESGYPLDMPLPDGLTAPEQLPANLTPGEPFELHPDPYGQEAPSAEPAPVSLTPSPSVTESASSPAPSSTTPSPSAPAGKASPSPTPTPTQGK